MRHHFMTPSSTLDTDAGVDVCHGDTNTGVRDGSETPTVLARGERAQFPTRAAGPIAVGELTIASQQGDCVLEEQSEQ